MACFSVLQHNILPHSSPSGVSAIRRRIMNYLSNRHRALLPCCVTSQSVS